MDQQRSTARLGAISFGLACGATAAIFTFALALSAALFGWGVLAVQVLSSLFIGYEPSIVGAFAGAVWAFVDALVAGASIAWFYNFFLVKRRSP
jgi:hypothetical protein